MSLKITERYSEMDIAIASAVTELASQNIHVEPVYAEIQAPPVSDPYPLTDLTYLKPHGGRQHIEDLCTRAMTVNAKTVCVQPIHLSLALHLLQDSSVDVITVESFPYGTAEFSNLINSIQNDSQLGAREIDIVFPHHFMTNRYYFGASLYLSNLRQFTPNIVVKVILETSDYSPADIALMSLLVKHAGFEFVKTSTGFSTGGATLFDVALMRRCVGYGMGVKASGGIKTVHDALALIEAGASRIGASSLSSLSGGGTY